MNILILSCNTGGGHNAAAYALREAMHRAGHRAEVFDHLSLAHGGLVKMVEDDYVGTVTRTPLLFGLIYQLGKAASRILPRSPVYYSNKKLGPALGQHLAAERYDAIVMTHLFPAETLTALRRQGFPLPPTIAVMTDYDCIPFWGETRMDRYIIPHADLTDTFVRGGLPPDHLAPLGIPVSGRMAQPQDVHQVRSQLALPVEGPVQLLVGGSMGAGSLAELAGAVHAEGAGHFVVICGNNADILKLLSVRYKGDAGITILGHTDDMPLYLHAADIVYTKPGGLTSTEAAAARVPIVHTAPIPGVERANCRFFTSHDLSISAKTPAQQAAEGAALLRSPDRMDAMRKAQAQTIPADAADRIVAMVADMAGKNRNCA